MKYVCGLLLIIFLFGCEKHIDIQTETQKPLLVVDGTIENGKVPNVILSTSLNYFSSISPEILLASNVTDANVSLSNGDITVQLKKYSQPLGAGFNLVYYSSDSTDPSKAMRGELGKTYTLQIQYKGSGYTSVTHVPRVAKTVDSLWWKPAPHNTDSTKVVLMARLTDPKGYGNYIRYFTKVDSGSFLPGLNSVYDDQITDGTVYDAQVYQGVDRNNKLSQDDYGYFKKGDTVTVKLANIDKATYDFWRTIEFGYQSVGNPFSSPTKVLSNVSNGALGAFCGYGVEYKMFIIPR